MNINKSLCVKISGFLKGLYLLSAENILCLISQYRSHIYPFRQKSKKIIYICEQNKYFTASHQLSFVAPLTQYNWEQRHHWVTKSLSPSVSLFSYIITQWSPLSKQRAERTNNSQDYPAWAMNNVNFYLEPGKYDGGEIVFMNRYDNLVISK